MGTLANWVSHNFLLSLLIAVVMVIGGAGIALGMKEGGRWGWLVLVGGVVLGAWTLRLNGYL